MYSHFSPRSEYIYVAFLLVSIAIYAASFDNGFRDDDFAFIRTMAEYDAPGDLLPSSGLHAFYRPGALLLFWAAYQVFGLEMSGAYIALNFVIHVLNSLCLVNVLRGFRVDRPAAYLAGGLCVLGLGQYGKKVMWASTSGPLFAILLVMCSLRLIQLYHYSLKGTNGPRMRYLIGAGILMLTAPAFHEVGLISPILVITFLIIRGYQGAGRRSVGCSLLPSATAFSTLAVWMYIYYRISREYDAYSAVYHAVARTPLVLFRHLGFMLLPIKPSPLIEEQPGPVKWLLSISAFLHIVIAAAIIAMSIYVMIRGHRRERFLVIWMYLAAGPFCLVDMPEGWLELRYVYCAAIPLCGLIAIYLMELYARGGWRRCSALAITALAAAMTIYVTVILEMKYDAQARSESNRTRYEEIRRLRLPLYSP